MGNKKLNFNPFLGGFDFTESGGNGGASNLNDLSDVSIVSPANRHGLMHDGTDWKNRLLVEADISDLGSYITGVDWGDVGGTLSSQTDLQAALDDIGDGTTNKQYSSTEKTKLAGIEEGADVTANAGATMNADTSLAGNGYFLDEDDFNSDSDTKVPSQQSTKAYIASQVSEAGDVSGPASATDGVPALFDGTTGKTLKNSTPTGTGNPVLATSPTLVTPNLGTPSAAVLTNATGLPPAGRVGGFKGGVISGATLGTTGNKGITGVGFTPKLVTFHIVVTASTAAGAIGVGMMTTGEQYYTSVAWSTSTIARNASTSACLGRVSGASSTPVLLATFVSMDADGFTINVGTADSTFDVFYMAYA